MMTLAAVPSYLLARMLVSRRGAVVVALGSVAVPGMAYATSIVSDVLAYPYYALCSWVAVRALRSRRPARRRASRSSCSPAATSSARSSSRASPVAFVLAAAGLWLAGPAQGAPPQLVARRHDRGARPRRRRPAPLQPRRAAAHPPVAVHEPVLQDATRRPRPARRRLPDDGARALVVIGGLTSLRLPERRGDPVYRAYVAWTSAAIGDARSLHRGQGGVPLHALCDPLGGARPHLPLAAPHPRHGDGVRVEAHRQAGRGGGNGVRRRHVPLQGDPARLALLRRPGLVPRRRPRPVPPLDGSRPPARAARVDRRGRAPDRLPASSRRRGGRARSGARLDALDRDRGDRRDRQARDHVPRQPPRSRSTGSTRRTGARRPSISDRRSRTGTART